MQTKYVNIEYSKKISVDLYKILYSIEDEKFINPKSIKTLKDYTQKWDWIWVIKEIFNIFLRFFKIKNKTWFIEFRKLFNKIQNTELKYKPIKELNYVITNIETQIWETLNIKKKLKLAYLLSTIKDLKKTKNCNKIKLLQKNIKIGDIILLNKKSNQKFIFTLWSKALKAYDNKYETDFTHSAIIISINPIKIRHATAFSQNEHMRWCVENVLLSSYLKKCWTKSFDLLVLRPKQNITHKILNFSEKNIGQKYNYRAALWGGVRGIKSNEKKILWNKKWIQKNNFNCVEIIVRGLEEKKLRYITHPNEFLEYMNIFHPVYVTSINL